MAAAMGAERADLAAARARRTQRRSALTTEAKVGIGFLATFLVIAALTWIGYRNVEAHRVDARMVVHTREVLGVLTDIETLISRAGAAQRSYVLTGESMYLAHQQQSVGELGALLQTLRGLITDNPRQTTQLDTLAHQVEEWRDMLDRNNEVLMTQPLRSESMRSRMTLLWEQLISVRSTITDLSRHEHDLLRAREALEERRLLHMKWTYFGLIAAMALLLAALYPRIRREIRERHAAQLAAQDVNERLRTQTDQLNRANEELEAFTYSVSHDLRAPVRAIDGFARILEEEHAPQLDEEGRRLLGVVRTSSQRMGKLIDELLAFSRLGRQSLNRAPVDMRLLVQRAIEGVDFESRARAEVTVGPLPHARGDSGMLQQVWANLIDNAVKYSSRRQQPQVHVDSYDAAGEYVYRVRDNGAGFDMRYYDKLFGVFQRLHGAHDFPGTGVGLAIVKRVVERHEGRVWAEAAPDRGATFCFSLPRAAE